MNILDLVNKQRIYFDGGMGTLLQVNGLKPGEEPAEWSITHPDVITSLHKNYLEAGANIVKCNTFGVTPLKFKDYESYIKAAVECAKNAAKGFEDKFHAERQMLGVLSASCFIFLIFPNNAEGSMPNWFLHTGK